MRDQDSGEMFLRPSWNNEGTRSDASPRPAAGQKNCRGQCGVSDSTREGRGHGNCLLWSGRGQCQDEGRHTCTREGLPPGVFDILLLLDLVLYERRRRKTKRAPILILCYAARSFLGNPEHPWTRIRCSCESCKVWKQCP